MATEFMTNFYYGNITVVETFGALQLRLRRLDFRLLLIQSQTLCDRVALVPDENVLACQFIGPFRREFVDTLNGHAINVIAVVDPRVRAVK